MNSVWPKKCLVFLVKKLRRTFDAELFNVERGLHDFNLLVNESRWSDRKGGYTHAERPDDVDDHNDDERRNYCIGNVLAQNMNDAENIATDSAGERGCEAMTGLIIGAVMISAAIGLLYATISRD